MLRLDRNHPEENIATLRSIYERAWSIHTGFCADSGVYYRKDPAWEQCATTTVSLQKKIGGVLMKGIVVLGKIEKAHYWLKLKGLDIDFCWRQFSAGTTLKNIEPATREELIQNEWMESRLDNLEKRLTLIENELKTEKMFL